MSEELAFLTMDMSAFSIGLPLITGIFIFSRLNWNQKMLFLLVVFSFAFELAALLVGLMFESNNLPLLHLFTLVQFFLLAILYRKNLLPFISPQSMDWMIGLFFVMAIISAFFFDGILRFNTYARALESILLIFFSLTYFYKILKELIIKKLEREPMFWVSSGVLIYFSGSIIIFIISNYFIKDDQFLLTAWGIHALLNILMNIIYAIALWTQPTDQISPY